MPLDVAVNAIEARAATLWPTIEATVALAFENTGFQQPVSADINPGEWIMVRVDWNGGEFMTVGAPGANLVRREGLIWVHGFISQGTGVRRAHQLTAEAAGMFEGQEFGGIVCQAIEPGGATKSEDGNYFGQSASIPFNYDETA